MDKVLEAQETQRIRALVAEGLASGICEEEPEAVIERIIEERDTSLVKRAKL